MKKATILMVGMLLGLAGMQSSLSAQGQTPELRIQPEEVEIAVGDSIQLVAVYTDTAGIEQDTAVTWQVDPDSLGALTAGNNLSMYFVAEAEGEGWIYASFGELTDSVEVTVEAGEDDEPEPGEEPVLQLSPEDVELTVGDSVRFTAVYTDSMGGKVDTTVNWSVAPDSLGTINAEGWFTATAAGEGYVYVSLGDLADSAEVEVEDDDDSGEQRREGPGPIFVTPSDTTVHVGNDVQFHAWYRTDSAVVETTATWSLIGMGPISIGEISEDGLLSVDTPGLGIVSASVGEWHATATVIAEDTTGDDTTNSIVITRDNPSPRGYNTMARITEGQAWTIGGLHHPMNFMNGGLLYFPKGSLKEDIRIHISLPGFAYTTRDSVGFRHQGVVTGLDFQVSVNDTVKEPYYFETPVIVSFPFKRGLLRHLNIDPTSLGMYFATTIEGDSIVFDSTGISDTRVDSSQNRIFSQVAHFSSLVVKERPQTTVPVTGVNKNLPENYALQQNYPNPFNPTTTISYRIPEREHVRLTIYNTLGEKVATLVNGTRSAGMNQVEWDARDKHGTAVPSGVYFYRLETDGYTQVRRMVLLR